MRLAGKVSLSIICLVSYLPFVQAQWRPLGDVSAVQNLPNGVELSAGSARVRVAALSTNVVRVRYAPQGSFPADHSFAVLPNAFPDTVKVQVKDTAEAVVVDTGSVQVKVLKSPLSVTFLDANGKTISEDRPHYPVSFNGESFRVWKSMPLDEHYFGLGDKMGPLDRRDLAFSLWNMDMFGYQESTDPIYKSIPFFIGVLNGAAYGIFLDDTYRSSFDFGKEFRDAYSFGSEAGELDYYFFYGPDPKRVVSDFTALVGRTPLPPLFALGYQQCRYSYYPEARVREVAGEFRKRKIPADVLYLDIDYQEKYRPFTIDRERFPHFEGMVKDLRQEGFKLITITDLHIAKVEGGGYKPYEDGLAHDYFVKNPDGSVYVGPVWPGPSVFPDFTRSAVRDWWGTLYTDFVKMGVRGFWNDMNEPAVFVNPTKTMPLDTVHYVEERKTDHREIHNVFGMQNVRGTYEGLLKLQPDVRPFVLTRAAYAGTERYAATWTGDNTASWNHMRLSLSQLMGLGTSGYAFVGDDIGGFNGSPTPDLLTRWMELGAFNPIYRNHAAKGTRNREPWVDGPEHEAIRRRYIETRYRILPYIYTGMEEASRTGVPLMRPMYMEFPSESTVATAGEQYMFGSAMLVAPKVWPFLDPYDVILPKGNWFNYWTGEIVPGGQTLKADPPLDVLPVYVRAGSIIPQQPVVQNIDETPSGPLELRVYPGPDCSGSLYVDDGNTFAYQKGEFLRTHFTCAVEGGKTNVHIAAAEGTYHPWFKDVRVSVYGPGKVSAVQVDGKAVKTWKSEHGAVTVDGLAWTPGAHDVEIQYASR
ncbi:MAG TPA: TIM-barrel domain-containing protein [Terriglobales bacterium]|nr:TIM-barrel domain-containing protein [Terriglobales bacterium]